MRSSIRLILALFMLAGTALAAPAADPNAPEANDEVSAKASETPAKASSKAKKTVEAAPAEEVAAAPEPETGTAAPPEEAAPEAETAPDPEEDPASQPQEAAPAAEAAPAPTDAAAPTPPAAEASTESAAASAPDWWGPIRDATNAEIDKSAGTASVSGTVGATGAAAVPGSTGSNLWRGVSALLIVLALIVACYVALLRIRRHAPMLAGGDFATVVGRLSLDSRFALHFVRVGEKVLLLGVTPQSINILEVFDAASFQRGSDEGAPEVEPHQDFLAHLRASGAALNPLAPGAADDEEIVSLRGDIERLKRYLEEGPRVDPEQ